MEVVHFAEVQYYRLMRHQRMRLVFAAVKCHTALPPTEYVIPPALRHARLAKRDSSGICFIPATSFISRVLFINNSKLPEIRNEKCMFVSPDLDHRYEFTEQ
jgi:hypothetical protein